MVEHKTLLGFADSAVYLASRMQGTPPVLMLADLATGEHEVPDHCPLSGTAGRVAILSMTFCNPLALNAASIIEGSI